MYQNQAYKLYHIELVAPCKSPNSPITTMKNHIVIILPIINYEENTQILDI